MKTNVKPIESVTDLASGIQLATVLDAEGGEARSVYFDETGESPLRVVGHSSEVSPLHAGDRVVILITAGGAIVTQRLRETGERPSTGFSINEDGSLSVRGADGITLATETATIKLCANGKILVDGREIYAIADGLHRLQGSTISLN